YATEDLRRVEAAGASFNVMLFARLTLAQVLIKLGEHDAARSHLFAVREFAEKILAPGFGFIASVAEASPPRVTGPRAEAATVLARAFAIGREHDYLNCSPFWQPDVMSRLCALALEEGIETQYVLRLIKKRGLVAPTPEALDWPFPIKI